MIGKPERRDVVAGKMPRRRTDVVEDAVVWVLSSLALLLVVVAVVAAVAAHGHIAERVRTESRSHIPVQAVLLEAAPVMASEAGYRVPLGVEAEWTAPDGTPRTGQVPVAGPAQAGARVVAWVDRQGDVVTPPPTMVEAGAAAVFTAACVLACGAVLLAGGWALARRAIATANSRYWERAWAEIGPRWTGRG